MVAKISIRNVLQPGTEVTWRLGDPDEVPQQTAQKVVSETPPCWDGLQDF